MQGVQMAPWMNPTTFLFPSGLWRTLNHSFHQNDTRESLFNCSSNNNDERGRRKGKVETTAPKPMGVIVDVLRNMTRWCANPQFCSFPGPFMRFWAVRSCSNHGLHHGHQDSNGTWPLSHTQSNGKKPSELIKAKMTSWCVHFHTTQ